MSEPVREAETLHEVAAPILDLLRSNDYMDDPDWSEIPAAWDAIVERDSRLLADRDRLAGEAETYRVERDTFLDVARFHKKKAETYRSALASLASEWCEWGCNERALAALSDSKEKE